MVESADISSTKSLWSLSAKNIDGEDISLQTLANGKKCVMVVNVASL